MTASSNGTITGTIVLPSTLKVGDAKILVSGYSADGTNVLTVGLGVKVKAGFSTLAIAVKAVPMTAKIPAAGTKALAVISTKIKGYTYVKVTLQVSQATTAAVAAKMAAAVKTAVSTLMNKLSPKPVQVYVILAPKKLLKTAKTGDVSVSIQYTK